MLWAAILPAKITFTLLFIVVAVLTARAPRWKWRRLSAFLSSSLLGCLLFIPSCIGVTLIVDQFRFGTFHYASASDVKDFRVSRDLPSAARNITVTSYASGHVAMYSISESGLKDQVNLLWNRYGETSTTGRKSSDKSNPLDTEVTQVPTSSTNFDLAFKSFGWEVPESVIEMSGPVAPNGAGADYYYDHSTQTGYHRASYW